MRNYIDFGAATSIYCTIFPFLTPTVIIWSYFKRSANKVDSDPTTLKGGTYEITVALSFGIAINIIPVKKFINSGENFLERLKLSTKMDAIKTPEAMAFLENGLAVLSIWDIHWNVKKIYIIN